MNWGLIGCGVIGGRRAAALPAGVKLTACFDPNEKSAQTIATQTGAQVCKSADEVLEKCQAVVIAAINSALVPLIQKALDKGVHVLVEKPAARNAAELSTLKNPKNAVIKIGFNHRFHPAYKDLLEELKKNADDPIMFIRAQYGNGARVGFDREWRSNVELSGGGELLDQGVHVIDLATAIVPDLKVVNGYVRTHYWDMNVDDNGWGLLASPQGQTFTFHVSSSEWKNEFRFEVYTRKRKYQWLGLGRSYGPEKLLIYKMKPEMGPPDFEERAYPGDDLSWKTENENFLHAIEGKAKVFGGFEDGVKCLTIVDDIFKSSYEAQNKAKGHPVWWGMPR